MNLVSSLPHKTIKTLPLLFGILLGYSTPHLLAKNPSSFSKSTEQTIADRILHKQQQKDLVWGPYSIDLSMDALLALYQATGDKRYRDSVMSLLYRRNYGLNSRIPYESQPFGHLNFRIYEITADPQAASAFVDESLRYQREVPRGKNGILLHKTKKDEPPRVLIDAMQDYASRMARAGKLSGNPKLYAESVRQFRLHRNLLRNPETGLWCQGQGWESDPLQLSPGAWSRGQGWILRGMTDALEALPPDSPEHRELLAYYRELIDALLPRQDSRGMWHALPHLPNSDSPAETSGTALICSALYRGLQNGWISGKPYRAAADRAFAAIAKKVGKDGVVSGACVGPGPMSLKHLPLYSGKSFREDDPHGSFTVLYACASRADYRKHLSSPSSLP